ncbi:glycosyltransferase family 4 protein [Colwellia sp. 12G3]|uniref:glycosyltransferase family 4 protein n=1 Tax=Colwellia sp. 12G3 TaxID=2058299 RepID=UPI000C329A8F|nr:glycosyltransferase family 4 protein [Colwellia sp. 12G3]PKI15774.1 glycosyl transferase family 1 [Colwellia sp. 12G3]
MNILVLTTLYPNNVQYRHGIFIENRVKELVKRYPDAKVKVVAPVPYFPSWLPIDGYKQYSDVVQQEVRSNIDVFHPKYWVIPKVGMNITPYFLYQAALSTIKDIQASGFVVDVIDSHYFYPDGVVASWIGKNLNIPVMVTARGSDINIIPENKIARKRIVKALIDVQASAAVSQALANEMVKLAPFAKTPIVLRNGVDLDFFHPDATKPNLPFDLQADDKLILSVGNLVELKGHHLVIEALTLLDKVKLIIIGEGEQKPSLQKLVEDLSLTGRVYFTGNIRQAELPGYYATADALVLASSREGMPNVLLESLACGTPVIATNVGGSSEVITQNDIGQLLHERSAQCIAQALTAVLAAGISSEKVRLFSQRLSWEEVTKKQYTYLNQLITRKAKDSK